MTQASVLSWITYLGDGVLSVFPYPFRIGAAGDISAYLGEIQTTAFTVTGVGNANGGTVVFAAPPGVNVLVFLTRTTPQTQLTDYINNDPFGAETHEAALDKLTREVQDLVEPLSRAPKLPLTTQTHLRPLTFPPAGAGRVIGYTADGTNLTTYPSQLSHVILPPPQFPPGLSVKDYGAVGSGLVNDAPAIQEAFTQAAALGIRHVHFPPGSYRLDFAVTITDTPMQVSGAGLEVTKLLVNNPTGGIRFISTLPNAIAQSVGGAQHLWLHDLTFVAWGTGALNRGYALFASWPGPSMVPATPHATIANVGVRSQTYISNTASEPFFGHGLHLLNAQDARLTDIHIMQISNLIGIMLYLEYAHDAQAFRITLRGIEIIGGGRGVYATGWIENFQLSEFEIVAQDYAIALDQSAAMSDVQTPAVFIDHGHVNGNIQSIAMQRWNDVHITNLSMYAYPRPGVLTVDDIFLQDCSDVSITGVHFSFGPNQNATLMHHIRLINTHSFSIVGNTFVFAHDQATALQTGVLVGTDSYLGVIQGNTFYAGGLVPSTQGILLQPQRGAIDQLTVLGNRFENVETGIIGVDIANVMITDNAYLGPATAVALINTIGVGVIVRDNTPQVPRFNLATNSQIPSVAGATDGLVVAQNTAATIIIFFVDGYDSMLLEIYAANGNTTIQHNVNIILRGSVNVTLPTGSILTLRRSLGAWREVSRNF
jgi:Pectate lyase superfamily protein